MSDVDVDYAPTLVQKLAAEVLGTFVLVFFGVGTAVALTAYTDGQAFAISYVGIALAFGIAVMSMAYAVGHISGGHFNPAVSLGAALSGRLSWANAGVYAAAQVGGAILASLVIFVTMQGVEDWEAKGNMGTNGFGEHSPMAGTVGEFSLWGALIVEIVATAVFLYIILAATDSRNPSSAGAPLAIGLGLTAVHLATLPFTGTSVNPARSLGPALFGGTDALAQVWLFLVAPLIGAAIAGLTYALVFGRDTEPVAGSGIAAFSGMRQPGAYQGQQVWGQQEGWGGAAPGQAGWAAGSQEQVWGAEQQPVAQQYPGWQWDAQAQQWVPDPATAQQPPPATDPEGPRTQIRPDDGA